MSFQWNVQPYRWLYQLQEQYTKTVIFAGRKKAGEYAKEAQEWMKQNAPWEDRTEEERERYGAPYPPGARAGLRVTMGDEKEYQDYVTAYKAAFSADQRAIKVENVRREGKRNALNTQLDILRKSGAVSEKRAARISEKISASTQPITFLPNSRAAVTQVNKEYRSNRLPIIDLKFSHHPRVNYAIWLEISNGGRFGIISKAIDRYADKFMKEVHSLANLKQYRDRMVLGPEVTPEQTFNEVAVKQMIKKQRNYEPWDSTKKRERRRRKKEYNPDKARAWYEKRKAEQFDMDSAEHLAEEARLNEAERLQNQAKRLQQQPPSSRYY